jgi:large subunit ribosomal protein L13
MGTYNAKAETVQQDWYVVDANEKTLGRLATELARRLRGKHKAIYTPHVDTGDHIVVINAEKLRVTGNKTEDKMYHHNTGYPGGMRSVPFKDLMADQPTRILELAVKGMLPRGPLGRKMFKKLRVYAGAAHPHEAQNPQPLEIKEA